MDETQFQDLVDRLGEDMALWPDEARTGAEALLSRSEAARRILRDAVALRAAFDAPSLIKAPSGLAARIVARALEGDETDVVAKGPARRG